MNPVLKTSHEWSVSPEFVGLMILDPDGWNRNPEAFEYSFYKERITRREFEKRVMDSTIQWSLPKL